MSGRASSQGDGEGLAEDGDLGPGAAALTASRRTFASALVGSRARLKPSRAQVDALNYGEHSFSGSLFMRCDVTAAQF